MFMMEVAKEFLSKHKDWKWVFTTSAKSLRSNDEFIIEAIQELDRKNDNFIVKTNMSKSDYYDLVMMIHKQLLSKSCKQNIGNDDVLPFLLPFALN